ncbi:MAG: ATP-binding protein, partial [bacterium]|nr:ATP-binding protein [bacterium]
SSLTFHTPTPYFVIIRGPLGSGKTTVARRLAGEIGAEYFSIDQALEDRGVDHVGPDEECIPALNFLAAQEAMLPSIRESLARGRPVIVDGNFYHREQIDHLVRALPFPNAIFALEAPVELCIARDRARSKPLGEDAARAVHHLVSRFHAGIAIDAAKSADAVLGAIMEQLSGINNGV